MNKIYFNILLIVFLFAQYNFSQEFKATVSSTKVAQFERFKLEYTFRANDNERIESFQPPAFNKFKVLTGPNQSTSMQIVNGSVSSTITYSYMLVADEVGRYTIPPAVVNYKGEKLESNSITLQVIKGDPQKKTQANNPGEITTQELKDKVFILATADKKNVYKGEQVTVSFKLYTALNISSPQISKLPSYEGFWAEEIPVSNNIQFQLEMYKGQRFRVAEIKKVALFPTKSGELSLTRFELDVPVLVKSNKRSNDPFDSFFNDSFFARTKTVDFKAVSNLLKIKVKPLPQNNVPDSFTGAVGNFEFKASIDKRNTKVNETITLNVEVSGTGNIKLINVPEIEIPAGFEKYDPKTSENITNKVKMAGKKSIEYLVVPRIPGKKVLPPVEFSYFNPDTKKYYTLKSDEFELNVEKGDKTYESTSNSFSKEDVKLLNKDIRFIKTTVESFAKIRVDEPLGNWFWVAIILPPFILLGVVLIRRRQDKLEGNIELMKYKKADKAARQRLKAAKEAFNHKDTGKFYSEISIALAGYIQDKFKINKFEFTIERAVNLLKENNISFETIDNVKKINEKCEMARFSPVEDKEAEQNLLDLTFDTIVKIEGELKGKKK